ncbi:GNAT family N-acetyltransferase [Winogradskyella poriferorum]|uniref:GNAT family N-acetyltransferase n=1 Tax=Winogradskyella poriferorum TaxID=307627 RepID=UPI003D65526E
MTTTKQLNISNLLDLWKNATQPFKTFNEDGSIGFCFIKNSQWPNKIWLKETHSTSILNDISLLLKSGLDNLTFSYFDKDSEKMNLIFDYYGFNQVSYQYGMSLNLKELNPFEIKTPLKFELVTDSDKARLWSNTFKMAFGYQISEETIDKTFEKINYYNIYMHDKISGTVICHKTSTTLGVHSLGIIPTMRGKGLATQIMYKIVNDAIVNGTELATLQASQMAKSMYEKMGFKTDFLMRNYKLKIT